MLREQDAIQVALPFQLSRPAFLNPLLRSAISSGLASLFQSALPSVSGEACGVRFSLRKTSTARAHVTLFAGDLKLVTFLAEGQLQ